jgi:transcriptional regulator with XRE-family HTH domain
MQSLNIFKDRVKQLRIAHNLSMNEMSELFDMKGSAAINQFEIGLSKPAMDTIIAYCLFFGISADWLLGLSDTPYTKESIKAAKKAIKEKRKKLEAESIIKEVKDIYRSQNIDKIVAEPPKPTANIEGNLIFLENATFLNDILHNRKDKIKDTAIDFKPKSRREQMNIRRNQRYTEYLEYHLHGTEEPYYRIPM